jgi:hypothetical protein
VVVVALIAPLTPYLFTHCLPVGTPWCGGAPTVWIAGHQRCHESPRCLVSGQWTLNNNTRLDEQDALNGERIDRHFCVPMDVNRDNLTDIICNVGADLGVGDGYNELYLTSPNGSIYKVLVRASQFVLVIMQVSIRRFSPAIPLFFAFVSLSQSRGTDSKSTPAQGIGSLPL